MKRKVFHNLVSIEEAQRRLLHHFKAQTTGVENVQLDYVNGRVLAENIEAQIDVPSFDRAAMDGFAVQAEDTFEAVENNPVILNVIGNIMAGENVNINISKGSAIEVATGAVLPIGANAIVMIEYTMQKKKHNRGL